jgi:predicted transcriptional regulator
MNKGWGQIAPPKTEEYKMRNLTELYRLDLPHRAISVYIYLAGRAGKKNTCWPSIPTIAKELKLSESTTRRALDDLRKAGLIQTKQRYRENGGNSSLLYVLNML